MSKNKSSQPATREVLDEAVDILLEGMDKLYEKFKGDMNTGFGNIENRLRSVEVELSHVKDEINGLKADLSNTPTRREFEELKVRVDKHHPLS